MHSWRKLLKLVMLVWMLGRTFGFVNLLSMNNFDPKHLISAREEAHGSKLGKACPGRGARTQSTKARKSSSKLGKMPGFHQLSLLRPEFLQIFGSICQRHGLFALDHLPDFLHDVRIR
jgi:hypothetical protein